MSLLNFYNQAKQDVIQKGYKREIDIVEERHLNDITPEIFQKEYVYVVCNSGMKNQVAEKIFQNYVYKGNKVINHPGKWEAIKTSERQYKHWFDMLCSKKTDIDRVEYLESLPWIGKITKYHLARNLGIDCAKPDRHLTRMAKICGFDDVQLMCKEISDKTGDRIGTVDVVLWRYCNLFPKQLDALELCETSCVGQGDYYCDEAICAFVAG